MEWLKVLKDTPVPTILVVAGVGFIFLAVAGGITGRISVQPNRQKISFAVGAVLLVMGIIIYLSPASAPVPGPTPGPTTSQTTTPPGNQSKSQSAELVPPNPSEVHPDLLSAARAWPVVEKDDFSGSETNWCQEEGATNGQVHSTRRIIDGKYRWQMKFDAPSTISCAPTGGASLNDFYAAVDAKLVSGPSDNCSYGLQLRVVGVQDDQDYMFIIADNRYWQFDRWLGKEWKVWGWYPTKDIHPGEYNRLEVVADGARFYLYLNGDSVGYIDDTEITLGRTGLFVQGTAPSEVVVDFDNFEVRKKPVAP